MTNVLIPSPMIKSMSIKIHSMYFSFWSLSDTILFLKDVLVGGRKNEYLNCLKPRLLNSMRQLGAVGTTNNII